MLNIPGCMVKMIALQSITILMKRKALEWRVSNVWKTVYDGRRKSTRLHTLRYASLSRSSICPHILEQNCVPSCFPWTFTKDRVTDNAARNECYTFEWLCFLWRYISDTRIHVRFQCFIDGPYGTTSREIFDTEHAVLIGSGIGVTPFASILQSVMYRHQAMRRQCPLCDHVWFGDLPSTIMKLKKVRTVNRSLINYILSIPL